MVDQTVFGCLNAHNEEKHRKRDWMSDVSPSARGDWIGLACPSAKCLLAWH